MLKKSNRTSYKLQCKNDVSATRLYLVHQLYSHTVHVWAMSSPSNACSSLSTLKLTYWHNQHWPDAMLQSRPEMHINSGVNAIAQSVITFKGIWGGGETELPDTWNPHGIQKTELATVFSSFSSWKTHIAVEWGKVLPERVLWSVQNTSAPCATSRSTMQPLLSLRCLQADIRGVSEIKHTTWKSVSSKMILSSVQLLFCLCNILAGQIYI